MTFGSTGRYKNLQHCGRRCARGDAKAIDGVTSANQIVAEFELSVWLTAPMEREHEHQVDGGPAEAWAVHI